MDGGGGGGTVTLLSVRLLRQGITNEIYSQPIIITFTDNSKHGSGFASLRALVMCINTL